MKEKIIFWKKGVFTIIFILVIAGCVDEYRMPYRLLDHRFNGNFNIRREYPKEYFPEEFWDVLDNSEIEFNEESGMYYFYMTAYIFDGTNKAQGMFNDGLFHCFEIQLSDGRIRTRPWVDNMKKEKEWYSWTDYRFSEDETILYLKYTYIDSNFGTYVGEHPYYKGQLVIVAEGL